MSYSISTLLTRNLHDVFGENDSVRRRDAIEEIFAEDCVFHDPMGGVYRGHDEINRIAGALRAAHAGFQYQPIGKPEELGNAGLEGTQTADGLPLRRIIADRDPPWGQSAGVLDSRHAHTGRTAVLRLHHTVLFR